MGSLSVLSSPCYANIAPLAAIIQMIYSDLFHTVCGALFPEQKITGKRYVVSAFPAHMLPFGCDGDQGATLSVADVQGEGKAGHGMIKTVKQLLVYNEIVRLRYQVGAQILVKQWREIVTGKPVNKCFDFGRGQCFVIECLV